MKGWGGGLRPRLCHPPEGLRNRSPFPDRGRWAWGPARPCHSPLTPMEGLVETHSPQQLDLDYGSVLSDHVP